ncbi:MAG: transposase [Candidatus Aureabacteria bacterium]|nr:transposase [Candidatus Auribacterota bacterium]
MMGDDENDDLMNDFLEYDAGMGSDSVICPDCGEEIPESLFFDDEVECPACGRRIKREP